MAVFRALLLIALIAAGSCAALFIVTGNRRFLNWAAKLLKLVIGAGLLFFAVLIAERIV